MSETEPETRDVELIRYDPPNGEDPPKRRINTEDMNWEVWRGIIPRKQYESYVRVTQEVYKGKNKEGGQG